MLGKMLRKRRLEITLSRLKLHPLPKAYLEQYTIPPDVASEILFLAAYIYGDIVGKTVFDLGCGTGRLGIGAAILGAKEVVGVDVDALAIAVARKNAAIAGVSDIIAWIVGDIDAICGSCDTVIQNPPFGVRRRTADRKFIQKALELSEVAYSMHKSGATNREFIKRFAERCGGSIAGIFQMKLTIPPTFTFHRKTKYSVDVDLYRIVKRK